jgi:CBS-domain-containing membrane protein
MRVADVMTDDVYTTTEDTPLRRLAGTLGQHGISGMPVVRDGQVVGVISESDVLAKARRAAADTRGMLERLLHPGAAEHDAKHEATLVGEAMTAPAITVSSFCSVATAATRMLSHGVNRLPVVDDGCLIGIVTRADIVRAFARPDADVEHDAREQIALQQALADDPATVLVKVTEGDAVLTGVVRTQNQAETLSHVVREVPGVVAVRSNLTWPERAGNY